MNICQTNILYFSDKRTRSKIQFNFLFIRIILFLRYYNVLIILCEILISVCFNSTYIRIYEETYHYLIVIDHN